MKISLLWLKDYVPFHLSSEMLAHKFTMAGLEVEKIFSVEGDTVLELEITPNRPDCLNMLGIARELSAILDKPCRFPKIQKRKMPDKKCEVSIQDKEGCPRYLGTLIEGLKIDDASSWLKKRLAALGIRPINNAVDITNFCLMETGQPMHAFDYDKLIGGKVVVRRARPGETLVTIDGIERKLDPSILVIADERRPVAIAGIMGGKDTEVTSQTKNILLEAAYFHPVLIRRASRYLGLSSDSSYRFERGVDIEQLEKSAERAISLILETAGGKIIKRSDERVNKQKKNKSLIQMTIHQVNECLGAELTVAKCKKILKKLGFTVDASKRDFLKVNPPSFRGDIREAIDIIEEIARIIGYDQLPQSLPQVKLSGMRPDIKRLYKNQLRDLLTAQGFDEIITYSMINQKSLEKTRQEDLTGIKIQNPLTQEQEMMRPALLPSHLSVVLSNMNHSQKDLKFFEIGKIYTLDGEKETLALTLTGIHNDDWRKTKKEVVDFYDLKGVLEQALERTGIKGLVFEAKEVKFLERGQCAGVFLRDKQIGVIGKIEKDVLQNWDIKYAHVFFGQIDLDLIYQEERSSCRYEAIAEFPSITRDISLAIKTDITAYSVENLIRKVVAQESEVRLGGIKFIEEYRGDKIPSGCRGVTFSLTYQSGQARTLRDEEAAGIHEKVSEVLTREMGAARR